MGIVIVSLIYIYTHKTRYTYVITESHNTIKLTRIGQPLQWNTQPDSQTYNYVNNSTTAKPDACTIIIIIIHLNPELFIPCTVTSFFGRFDRASTSLSDGNDLLRWPEARGSYAV